MRLTVRRQGREMELPVDRRPPAAANGQAERAATDGGRNMRILVVEDDKDVAGFVVSGLKEAGHVVEHADNGRDGLFMAASENFDAIILDRMLPGGIDGLQHPGDAARRRRTPCRC